MIPQKYHSTNKVSWDTKQNCVNDILHEKNTFCSVKHLKNYCAAS